MRGCQERLEALRELLSLPPTRWLTESVLKELGGWSPGEGRAVGVEYALSHMAGWPDALRRVPRIWLEAVIEPHLDASSALREVLRPYATDGYLRVEVYGLPWGEEMVRCETCERIYEDHPRLWVSWSDDSITCIHCFFAAHARLVGEGDDYLAGKRDEAGRLIGGVQGYVARFLAEHDSKDCPWSRFESEHLDCLLCAARRDDDRRRGRR